MLLFAIILFAIAATLGVFLISYVLQNKETFKGVAFIHGSIAATGLIILIIYALLHKPSPIISILIFLIVALLGFMLIFRDITGKRVPKWLALTHGILAIFAFVFLLLFTFVI